MIKVEISNRQRSLPIDRTRLRSAVRRVLQGEGYTSGSISLGIVDDPTIHELNRQHLQHDYATDVLSWLFERTDDAVDGEIIASADTAIRFAEQLGKLPDDELLLYIVHGSLHLVGYDDQTDEDRQSMRQREQHYLEAGNS